MATSFRTKNRPQKAYQGWSDIDHIYVMFKAPCKGGIIPMKQWGRSWVFAHVGTVSWFQAIYIFKLLTINNKQPYLDFGLTSSPTSKIRYTWKMVFFLLLDERSPCNMQLSTKLISQRTNPPWAPLFGLKKTLNTKTSKKNIPPLAVSPWFPFRSHQQTFMNQQKTCKKTNCWALCKKSLLYLRLELHVTALHPIPSTWVVGEVVVAFQPWHRVLLSRRLSRSSWFRGKGTGDTWRERRSIYFKQFQW